MRLLALILSGVVATAALGQKVQPTAPGGGRGIPGPSPYPNKTPEPVTSEELIASLDQANWRALEHQVRLVSRALNHQPELRSDASLRNALEQLLFDKRQPIGLVAASALARMDDASWDLGRKAIDSPRQTTRQAGMELLASMASRDSIPPERKAEALARLGPRLATVDAFEGPYLHSTLRRFGPPGDAVLAGYLSLPPFEGGTAAAKALAQSGEAAVPWLEKGLASDDPVTRRNAAFGFKELDDGEAASAASALIKALDDPDHETAHYVAWALQETKITFPDAALVLALHTVKETDLVTRRTLRLESLPRALKLARHGVDVDLALSSAGPDAVPALVKALSEDSYTLRGEVMEALRRLGVSAKAATPRLRELLQEGDGGAAFALAHITPEDGKLAGEMVERLADGEWDSTMHDGVPRFYSNMIAPLVVMRPNVLPQILAGLKHKNTSVRYGCLSVLRGMSLAEVRPIVPQLRKLLRTESDRLTWEAVLSIPAQSGMTKAEYQSFLESLRDSSGDTEPLPAEVSEELDRRIAQAKKLTDGDFYWFLTSDFNGEPSLPRRQ